MSDQYQPTAYYDWVNRTHGIHLVTGNYQLVPYDYYAGDELHVQNVVFRNSDYVTYDNTHVRFLNKSDIHVYDTSNLVIHDSGTLTMYTSSDPGARSFVVDEIGRVGIGMNHIGIHANNPESPSFDLDVRGQIGIEDYIYHNDDTDTYMLFGADTKAHHVNADGSITPPISPPDTDYDEINFRVGGVDMLQMKEDDTQDQVVINKNQADVDIKASSSTNTQSLVIRGDGTEVVINEDGNADTDFRVEGSTTPHMLHVDTSTNHVTINGPAGDNTDILTVTGNGNNSLSGASLLRLSPADVVINEDGNQITTRIESNTNPFAFTVKGDGTEVVINGTGAADSAFRVESNTSIVFAADGHPGQTSHSKQHALFVNTSTGGVGLGTATPDATLHVVGDAHIEGDLWIKGETNQVDTLVHVTSAMDITNMGTGPALMVTQTGNQPVAAFYDNEHTTGPVFYIENNGNVGIGDDDPDTVLHIKSQSPVVTLEDITGVDTQWHQSKISSDSSSGALHLMADTGDKKADSFISFRIDGEAETHEKARFTSLGNLGLGTSTPESYDAEADDFVIENQEHHTGITIASLPGTGSDNYRGNIFFADGTNGSQKYSGGITYDHEENDLSLRTGGVERVWISSDGKVGIGIHDPSYPLESFGKSGNSIAITSDHQDGTRIQHAAMSTNTAGFGKLNLFSDVGNRKVEINSDGDSFFNGGDVGIGVESPDGRLHLRNVNAGSDDANLVFNYASNMFSGVTSTEYGISYSEKLHIGSVNTASNPQVTMTMEKDGNVGIGTTNPDCPLMIKAEPVTGTMLKMVDETSFIVGESRSMISFQGKDSLEQNSELGGIAAYASAGQKGGLKFTSRMVADGTTSGVMVLSENGNVGIVTETPDSELEVEGTLHIRSGDGTNAGAVRLIGTIDIINGSTAIVGTNTQFQVDLRPGDLVIINTTDYFVDVISSNTAMTVTQAITNISATGVTPYRKNTRETIFAPGNVGFGTMTPIYNVESFGKVSNTLSFTSNHQDGTRIQHAAIGTNLTGFGRLGLFSDVGNPLIELNSTPGDHSFINNGGNLAIGHDNPTGKLYVNNGSGHFYSAANDVFRNATTLTNGQHSLIMQSGGWTNAGVLQQVTGATAATTNTFGLYLNSAYGSRAFSSSSIHVNCGQSNGDIRFSTGDGNTSPTEQMTIANNGEVTINQALHLGTDLAVVHGGTGRSTWGDKCMVITQPSGAPSLYPLDMSLPGSLIIGGSAGPINAYLTAGNGISISNQNNAITISHDTGTSSASSTTAAVGTYVSAIQLDTYGHVVSVSTAPETIPTRASMSMATTDAIQFNGLGVGMAASSTAGEVNATADIVAFAASDKRLKNNLKPITNPIEKLSKINGYEFDWLDNDVCSHTGHDIGVIAQEIEEILPEIVTTRDNGYKAVKYEKLTALLIEVTKSQQTQIDELKHQIQQLIK